MKNLKNILFLTSISISFLLSENNEEEIRTIDKDGKTYKINNSSLHLTPYNSDNNISKISDELNKNTRTDSSEKRTNSEKAACDMPISISFGTQMAIGDYYTEIADPGTSMAITLSCPKTLSLFGEDFNTSYGLSMSNLSGINRDDISFTTLNYSLNSSLNNLFPFLNRLPFTYGFSAGLTNVDGDNDINDGMYVTLGSSVNYDLPIKNHDLSLSLNVNQTINSDNTYGLYSFSLNYGKNLSCNK